MEEVYQLILARNARESIPFQSVYGAYEALQRSVDALQLRCDVMEYEWGTINTSQVCTLESSLFLENMYM